MKNCDCHTEINTDGSGQLQRYLKALDPSYAPIDNRSIEDLLVFAKRYAGQIRFYDLPEIAATYNKEQQQKLSWKEFFRRDMAIVIASVGITDVNSFKKEFNEVRDKLETDIDPDLFAALFNPILGMLKKIDRWYALVIPENPLYKDLELAIQSDLRGQAQNILAYKKQYSTVNAGSVLKIDLEDILNKKLWGLDQPVLDDGSLYQGNTYEEQIRFAALNVEDIFYSFYNFLSKLISDSGKYLEYAIEQYPGHQPHMALFITFLELFRIVQQQMNGLTERMLNFYYREVLHLVEKPSIPDKAHIVFELAKEVAEYQLEQGTALSAGNDLSGKEQLYKTENDFVINQAKVTELKTIFVEKKFLYGKEVKEEKEQVIHSIYARPVANSQDGFGEKFTDPNPKWYTFGAGTPVMDKPKNICQAIEQVKKIAARKNDLAQIGFSIASPQLLMEGGKRLIQVIFQKDTFSIFKSLVDINATDNLFEIWFTGEKKWIKVNKQMSVDENRDFTKFLKIGIFNPEALVDEHENGSYYIDEEHQALSIYLPISEQAVVGYDEKNHKDFKYSTSLPVMQIRLHPIIDLTASDYKKLTTADLSLHVKVGSVNPILPTTANDDEKKVASMRHYDGLNKLVLHTENGLQPVGKPFDPFSPYPAKGKFFYIGSEEVFNKPFNLEHPLETNDQIAVTVKKSIDTQSDEAFIPLSASHNPPTEYMVEVLKKRDWKRLSAKGARFGYFSQFTLRGNILTKATEENADNVVTKVSGFALPRLPIQSVSEWKPGTEKGFLKITNIERTRDKMEERQNQAAEMEIAEIYLSYDSTLHSLQLTVDEFYHVYPFGNVQIYTNEKVNPNDKNMILRKANFSEKDLLSIIPDKEADPLIVEAKNYLLPHFTYENPYEKYNTNSKKGSVTVSNSYRVIARMKAGASAKLSKKIKQQKAVDSLMLNASGLLDKLDGAPNQYSATVQEEGLLQVGIENLKPLQTVSLLFQFADGSAEDEDKQPPEIHWSYLTNNEWRPLKAENILGDGTFGFQTTGIIKISIPEDATNHNSICSDGLHWLCASVTKDSNRIPQLINVVAQATEVVFEDDQNDQSHFDKALPAATISKLVEGVPEVSKVSQPFASFDGKHREIGKEFYTRVSERLRHKHRAITPWDYEHIVLDRFPSIYKVKCITHTDPDCLCRDRVPFELKRDFQLKYNTDSVFDDASLIAIGSIKKQLNHFSDLNAKITSHAGDGNQVLAEMMANRLRAEMVASGVDNSRFTVETSLDALIRTIDVKLTGNTSISTEDYCCGPQVAPGHVLLVPIANLKNRNAVNPLQPKTGRRTLLEIESYLKKLTSPFVHVHAKNPVYEQILVFFRVKFYPQYEIGYYLKKLNDEIVHFLTPWAFDEDAEVKFGQKVYASSIINFIEERKYVDFITDFNMVMCKDECCPPEKKTYKEVTEGDILAVVRMVAAPGDAVTAITGVIKNKADNSFITNVKVTAGATNITDVTNASGEFTIDPGSFNATLIFSFTGYVPASVDVDFDQEIEVPFIKQEHAVLNEWGLSIDKIEKLCGCSSIEYLLQDEMDLPGNIVARPSTPRSILVSASQHIIVPYQEPPNLTPCEKKAMSYKNSVAGTGTVMISDVIGKASMEPIATGRKRGSSSKETKKAQPVKKNTGRRPNK